MTGAWTRETPAPGLVVWQPARGFRYALDPFLLGGWILEGGWPADVVDLGTGSGILALLLARRGIPATGWDVRPEWIEMARRSAVDSGLSVRFLQGDMRRLPPGHHDLAVMNPPYWPLGRGPTSPDALKAAARMEGNGTLDELVHAATRQAPRVGLVLRAGRGGEARRSLGTAGFGVVRSCTVDDALVLLDARAGVQDRPEEATRVPTREGGVWSGAVRSWYERLGAPLTDPQPGPRG